MPRKKSKPPVSVALLKKLMPAFGVVVLVILLVVGWQSRSGIGLWMQNSVARMVDARVKEVLVSGTKYTEAEALKTALGLELGSPLVGFDVRAAKERVELLPWVRDVSLSKRLPSTVKVDITEYMPIARLRDETEGEIYVIAKSGHSIVPATEEFDALPLLSGRGAAPQAASLFLLLQDYANFSAQLVAAEYIGERRWNLQFAGGLMVKLPAEDAARGLALLQQLEEQRHVLSLDGGSVDLRLKDRIILELPVNADGTELVL